MKDNSIQIPPLEDEAVQAAIDGTDEEICAFLKQRPDYEPFVREIQSVKDGLQSIENEEPPSYIIRNIIKKLRRPPLLPWLQDLPFQWYRNPFILSFGCLMAIIFFYFFIVFVVK